MATALTHKSWTDLSRRPARAVLTTLTLSLAVASFGILAIPSLMNRAMNGAVDNARLYNLAVTVDDVALSPAQLHRLATLPNVIAMSARSLFATRSLIDGRRVATEVWGVPNLLHQPVDQVVTTARPSPGQVLVDAQDAQRGISAATTGDTVRIQAANGSLQSLTVAGSATAMAFNQDAYNGHLILYASQATVQRLGGFTGVNYLEFRLADASQSAAQQTADAVRTFLAVQPTKTAFSNLPTIRTSGDWPNKGVFDQRSKILIILIVLALISAALLLANTIRTMTAEQTREIGVIRGVGASSRDVRLSYLRTVAILGLFGAVIGGALGIGLTYLLVHLFAQGIFGIDAGFSVDWLVVAVSAVAGITGVLVIAWPTLGRALRTPVHEALVSEGLVSGFGAGPLDRAVMHLGAFPTPVRLGVRSVARQKGRSFTTIVQIALAVATLLGLLSLALAVSEVTDQSWNVLNYDITLSAQPGGHLYSPAIVNAVRSQPGVSGVEAVAVSHMTDRGQTLYAFGVHVSTFIAEPLAAGHWLSPADVRRGARVAIVGSAAARMWGLHPGSRLTVTTAGGQATFSIIGIGGSAANNGFNFYTTVGAVQAVTGHLGVTNSLLIRTANKDHGAINAVAARLENLLARSGYPSQSQLMYVGRANDKASSHTTLVIVEAMGLLIVAISMLGLINAITMNIIERTREIGVLRCLGARARDLRRMFRSEMLTLALAGFALAIPLGWLLAHVLRWLILEIVNVQLPAPYTFGDMLIAFVGTMLLAVVVVAAPLRRATRLRPGEAIRYS